MLGSLIYLNSDCYPDLVRRNNLPICWGRRLAKIKGTEFAEGLQK